MTNFYLDASAITKLVIDEPESAVLRDRLRGHTLISSRIAVVEVTKAAWRANPEANAQPILRRLAYVELDADLARLSATTGGAVLRALDAIHIASALRLGSLVETFVTYDDRQAAAAQGSGLSVTSPS